VVEWYDGEEEYPGPEETVFCGHCGEPTITVVAWLDLPKEGEERQS